MLNNLQQVEQHDYSQNIFIGKVVANDDPLRLRRVKVAIPNLFEEDTPATLPWVAPMFLGFVANGAGGGSANLAPAVGTEVVVEFQMGSPLHGLYIASPLRPGQLPAEFMDDDWQWTYGWKDPVGNIFLVNTKSGSNTIRLFHASGTELKIINSGKVQIHGVENLEVQIDGNTQLTTNGDTTVTTQGNTSVSTQGNTSISTQGTTDISSQDKMTVTSQSEVDVSAPTVHISGNVSISSTGSTTVSSTGPMSVTAPGISLN
jgi:hypothetical protein